MPRRDGYTVTAMKVASWGSWEDERARYQGQLQRSAFWTGFVAGGAMTIVVALVHGVRWLW